MNKKEIMELMCIRDSINSNNPAEIESYWRRLTAEFLKADNEDEIIEFLYTLDDDDLMTASEVFDDINYVMKGDYFWNRLKELQRDRPHLTLDV